MSEQTLPPLPPISSAQDEPQPDNLDGVTQSNLPPLPGEATAKQPLITGVPTDFSDQVEASIFPGYEPREKPSRMQRFGNWLDRHKPAERARFVTKAGRVALIGLAMIAPGKGLIDRAADQFIDGGDATEQMLEENQVGIGETMRELLDSDSSDLGGLQGDSAYNQFREMSPKELKSHEESFVKIAQSKGDRSTLSTLEEEHQYDEAGKEVANIFQEIDDGNTDAINGRAHEALAVNPNAFMTDAEFNKTIEAIDSAQSSKDLLAAVQKAFDARGKTFDISQLGEDIGGAKHIAKDVLNLWYGLPTDFVKNDMYLRIIQVVPDKADGLLKIEAAHYEPNEQKIVMRDNWYIKLGTSLQGDSSLESTAHEMGHATDNGKVPTVLDKGTGPGKVALHLLNYTLGTGLQDRESMYAILGDDPKFVPDGREGEEARAETFAATISGHIDSPDSVRQFNSDANKERLKIVQMLERNYPGAASVLMSRTMDRSTSLNKQDLAQYLAFAYLISPHISIGLRKLRTRIQRNRKR